MAAFAVATKQHMASKYVPEDLGDPSSSWPSGEVVVVVVVVSAIVTECWDKDLRADEIG